MAHNISQEVRSAEAENAGSAHTLAQQCNCASTYFFMSWSIFIFTLHIQCEALKACVLDYA